MKTKTASFYQIYNRCLFWFCGMKWFQSLLLSKKLAAISLFYSQHKPAMNENEFIQRFLFNNSGDLRDWILYSGSPAQIMNHIHLEREKDLLELIGQKQGVILLNFHTGLSQAIHMALKTMGIAKYSYSIKNNPGKKKDQSKADHMNDYTSQIIWAAETLMNGGLVSISGDGKKGGSKSVVVPFLGRWQEFRTGFAELALATNTVVIPISACLQPDGTVKIQFHPPLEKDNGYQAKETQIKDLITKFSGFMAQQWIESPATIKYNRLLNYLKQPLIQGTTPDVLVMQNPDQLSPSKFGIFNGPLTQFRRLKKAFIQRKTH